MMLRDVKHVWAVINRDGYVWTDSIGKSRKESIRKFVKCIPEPWQEPWCKAEADGYICKRINVMYEIDESYNK